MPEAFAKPCLRPGCSQLARKGHYCPEHCADRRRAYDRRRGSSAARGYGGRWQRYRPGYLSRPENALCRMCERVGRIEPATDIDHIVPVSGPDDPLFWEASNHQPLCHGCHARKTATEDGGFGRTPIHNAPA